MTSRRLPHNFVAGLLALVGFALPLGSFAQPPILQPFGAQPPTLPRAVAPANVAQPDNTKRQDTQKPVLESSGPASVLKFRRVFAPAEREQDWPRGAARYVPVEPGEFERLVERASSLPSDASALSAAHTTRAVYEARWEDPSTLVGQTTLDIVHTGDTPSAMALEPCGLALGDCKWISPTSRPATLGVRDDGKLAVVVASSGQLKLDWSLRSRREATGPASFQLQLPACPAITLLLDLPEELIPVPERGVVAGNSAAEKGRLQWRIELGGQNRLAMRLAPRDSKDRPPAPIHVRETVTYDLAPRGVDVTAQWKLDVDGEPLRRLEVELEAGLRPVSVRYGDTGVAWSVVRAAKSDADSTRVALEFPEPILGADRVVRMAAVAPILADQAWRLPRIRPQGVVWHEGTIAILVRAPLMFDDLSLSACRQTRSGPLPASAEGEAIELQCFSPEATVDIALRRQQPILQVSSGTTVHLANGTASAEMSADLRATVTGRFLFEADVPHEWTIDSVQTTPREALADWNLDVTDAKVSVLRVRLARPLGPNSPVKLNVLGRRPLGQVAAEIGVANAVDARRGANFAEPAGAAPNAMPLAGLEMLKFRGATTPLRLLALVAEESDRLDLTNEKDLSRVPSDQLTPYEHSLLRDEDHAECILRLSSAAPLGQIAIEAQRPRYAAHVRVQAALSAGRLTESYVLRCTPESKRIGRVLVHFSSSRAEPLQWSLGDEGRGSLVARRLDRNRATDSKNAADPNDSADNHPEREIWEINLVQPRNTPFELRAIRSTEHAVELPIALALLPEATEQQAVLNVAAPCDLPIVIHNRGLQPIETEPVATNHYTATRAAYRYELSDAAAGLTVAPASDVPVQQNAWAWNCQVDSRLEMDGRLMHSLAYGIENRGRKRVAFTIPSDVEITGVWVDRTRIDTKVENDRVVIDLPPGKAFVKVVLECQSQGPRLSWFTAVEAPRVEPDMLVLAERFRLWTPPGYEAVSSSVTPGGARSKPLSWSQRLFGPLGRPTDSKPFDLFAIADWRGVSGGRESLEQASASARELVQRLTKLSTAASSRRAESPQTSWSDVLEQSQREADTPVLTVLVDWQALSEAGIGPQTTVAKIAPRDTSGDAESLLARAKLRLLACGNLALLTTCPAAVVDREQLEAIDPGTIDFVLPGPLADEMRASAAGISCRYLSPEKWKTDATVAWSDASAEAAPWLDDAWSAVVIEPERDGALRATVVRRSLVQSASWTVFLLVTVFSWFAFREREVAMIVMAGLFAALALLLPAVYAPLASGGVLGTLFALAVRRWAPSPAVVFSQPATERSSKTGSRLVRATQTAILLLAVGAIATSAVTSRAQLPLLAAKPPTAEVHRVFIPVDAKNNPTGGKYQVPESFYAELRRHAAVATGEPQGWLLQSAGYRATLSREILFLQRVVLAELTATFNLQVFADSTRVRLPIGNDRVQIAADGALLDARPVSLVRDADGQSFSFDVAEAGAHRLELSLRVSVQFAGDTSTLDLRIPPLANSTLELHLPADPPNVELQEAMGKSSMSQDKQKLTAQLGPLSHLIVRWSEGNIARDAGAAVDVDELLWLQAQQGAVVLQGKFKFKVHSGRVQQLQFALDPHLRPLPLEAPDPLVTRIETLPGEPRTLRVELSRPVTDQITVPLKFLVTGASGVGALGVPRLEVLGARSIRRWLGVSIASDLEFSADKLADEIALAVPDFVAQWGLAASPPQLALRIPPGETSWSVATRPRVKRLSARQSLALSANAGRLAVQFDASLTNGSAQQPVSDGNTFRHRLKAPADLRIDSVSVIEEGVQRVARWERGPQGDVLVILTAPTAGPQQLALRGWLPAPESGRLPLPLLRLVEADVRESVVHIWRQSSASVALADPTNLAEIKETVAANESKDLGRLVGSYLVDGQDARVTLVMSPNEPSVRANQVTSVSHDGNVWSAKVDYRCHVENGVLDLLRFDVPSDWMGPYEFTPAMPHEIVNGQGANRQQVVVRPRAAIQGDFRLGIHGPLRNALNDSVVAPDVVPRHRVDSPADATSRFVVLPTQMGLNRVQWETTGLRPAQLPAEWTRSPSASAAEYASYAVVGESPRALLKSAPNAADLARVRRAEVHVASRANGTCQGVAAFDLRVVGETSCQLRVPDEVEIVHIAVAGAPVTPDLVADGKMRIPLTAGSADQRIEIVFKSQTRTAFWKRSIDFAAPSIDDWPIDRSQWTVYGSPELGSGEARLAVDQGGSDSHLGDSPGIEANTSAAMPSPVAGAAALADMTLGRWRQPTRLNSPGPISRATIAFPRTAARDHAWRLAAALLVLAATAWSALGKRRYLAANGFARWPHAVSMAVGIAWWLWMTPSVLGLVIMAISTLLAIRDGWPSAGARGKAVAPVAGHGT